MTVNDITSRKSAVATAKTETEQAQARAGSLTSYGNFSQIKQQRVASVQQLAESRVDWERLARGLARVLPGGVWITTANASASPSAPGAASSGSSSSSSSSSSAGSAGASSGGPSVQLTGCAPSQDVVATTLVRLKELSGAQDVQLGEITQPDAVAGATGAPAGGSAGGGDCGSSHGHPNYNWTATVTFAPVAPSSGGADKVPATLGGGA
jgi:Tfp pilus assembly protein PilN